MLTGESQSSRRETYLSCRVVQSSADVSVCTFSPHYTRISGVNPEPDPSSFSNYASCAAHTSTLKRNSAFGPLAVFTDFMEC